eukprot:XP_016657054.1 PREDICTED: uncharacterized protein LOC107882733 isoform X3 [Acyrthosiphon pisum]
MLIKIVLIIDLYIIYFILMYSGKLQIMNFWYTYDYCCEQIQYYEEQIVTLTKMMDENKIKERIMNTEINIIKSRILTVEQQVRANKRYCIEKRKAFRKVFANINNSIKKHLILKNELLDEHNRFQNYSSEWKADLQCRLTELNNRLRELESE